MKKAFSLIEIVMAMGLFGVLATTVTVMLGATLRGARKAAAVEVAKNEGQFAMRAMADVVRFAKSWTDCSNPLALTIKRQNDDDVTYSLVTDVDNVTHIASSSSKLSSAINLTSNRVTVSATGCGGNMFTCPAPNAVNICFSIDRVGGVDVSDRAGTVGIVFESRVGLRNYGN